MDQIGMCLPKPPILAASMIGLYTLENKEKPRPVKFTVGNQELVRQILGSGNKLKKTVCNSEYWSTIYLAPDRD